MPKKRFLFHFESPFRSCPDFIGHVEKRLDKKASLTSKFLTPSIGNKLLQYTNYIFVAFHLNIK